MSEKVIDALECGIAALYDSVYGGDEEWTRLDKEYAMKTIRTLEAALNEAKDAQALAVPQIPEKDSTGAPDELPPGMGWRSAWAAGWNACKAFVEKEAGR